MSEQLHFNGIYKQDDGDEVNSPFQYRQGNI